MLMVTKRNKRQRIKGAGVKPLWLMSALAVFIFLSACNSSNSVTTMHRADKNPEFSVSLQPSEENTSLEQMAALSEIQLTNSPGREYIEVVASLAREVPISADFTCELLYEGEGWTPVSFEVGDAWGSKENVISLAIFDEPGRIYVGVSYIPPYRNQNPKAGKLFTVGFSQSTNTKAKVVSAPPRDEVNHIYKTEVTIDDSSLDSDGKLTLIWKEKNQGDYNRDGAVSIADVAPLARYWGFTNEDSLEIMEVVDGDGTGIIDIRDIVPIARNFFSRIEGYQIWRNGLPPEDYLPNLDNPSDTEISASRPDYQSAPPGRLEYRYTDSPPNRDPGLFYIIYAYAGGQRGARSDEIYPFGEPSVPDTTPPQWQDGEGITSAIPGDGEVYISWAQAVDEQSPPVSYLLYWSEASVGIDWGTPQRTVPQGSTSSLVTGLNNGTEYEFAVLAQDSANPPNVTTNRNTLLATPTAGGPDLIPPWWDGPEGIQTATPGDRQVTIDWTTAIDDDSPPVTYLIYYAPVSSGIDWVTPQLTVPEGQTTETITGLTNEVEYAFAVRAQDSADPPNVTLNFNYLTSIPRAGGPDETPPEWQGAPGIQSAVPGDGEVIISWTEAVDANSPPVTYLIYYAESSTGINWTTPQDTAPQGTRTKVVSGLTNGVEYEFAVQAQDNASPPNVTTNRNTLTATPASTPPNPYPFGEPPLGLSIIPDATVNDTAIVVDYEGNPAIVSVNKEEGVGGLWLHYFDEGTANWVNLPVAPGPARFYHPDILLLNGQIYVSSFDESTGKVMLFIGDSSGTSWTSEVVSDPTVSYPVCYASEMDYSMVLGEIGIMAVLSMENPPGNPDAPPNEELYYFSRPIGGNNWERTLVDNERPSISFASFKFNQETELPGIGYARGRIKYEINEAVLETRVAYAERTAEGSWIKADLPLTKYSEMVGFDFNTETSEPMIVFSNSRTIPEFGDAPITDAASYERALGNWYFSTVETGYYEVQDFTIILHYFGLDSQVDFAEAGNGVYAYVALELQYDAQSEEYLILTNINLSQRAGGWTTPYPVTDNETGASAISLAYNPDKTQISFVAIGVHDNPLAFSRRNDYVAGSLAYYSE